MAMLAWTPVSFAAEEPAEEAEGEGEAKEAEGQGEGEPTAEEPDESAGEEPAADEPTAEEPATEEPATEEPATEEPPTEEPTTEEPAPEEPTTETPATEEASNEEPADGDPVAKGPPPAPSPYFHFEPTIGAQAYPLGVGFYGVPQLRLSLYRSDSALFQTTHIGIGPHFRITPAFIEVGPRIDFTPVEIFTLSVTARYLKTWVGNAGARIPVTELADKRYSTRGDAEDTALPTGAFELVVSPTIRLKGGPVIVLYNLTWTFTKLFFEDGDTPVPVYDGGLDLYIAPTDFTIAQQAVVLIEVLDGVKVKPVVRLGATVRHRKARVTGDRTVNVGFIGTVKPVPHFAAPLIILQILPYVLDPSGERVLGPPNIQLGLRWTLENGPGMHGIPE
jgi:hypothetical protein